MRESEGSGVEKERPVLTDRMGRALAILSGTPISFSYQDADLRYVWFENAPADWDAEHAIGEMDSRLFPDSEAAALVAVKQEVLRSGISRKHELALDHKDGTRFFDLYLQPDCDESGTMAGLLTSIVDVTDRRRSEAIRQTLLREVTHRSKNLLAIVIGLAAQTSRTARSIDDFLERFNGRLQSIARSQDLVTETNWRGARLSELIATQVETFAADDATGQVEFEGRDDYLKANAALYVGLALHELAVNSVQHGALSSANGQLSVAVERLAGSEDRTSVEPAIRIVWSEQRDGGVEGPDSDEFGYVLLTRLVPAAVGGTATLTIDAEGLRYDVTLLRREYE